MYREWRKINPNNAGPMAFLREKVRTGDDIRRAQILSFAYDSHSINRNVHAVSLNLIRRNVRRGFLKGCVTEKVKVPYRNLDLGD